LNLKYQSTIYLDREVEYPAVQLEQAFNPGDEEYLPAPQVWQSVQSSAPSPFWYMPAGHGMHDDSAELPVVGRYFPCTTCGQIICSFVFDG
jgi:hypothetical protein